ncbi:unnamed protein product, partial [Discosporangium mesarthrocarpum]
NNKKQDLRTAVCCFRLAVRMDVSSLALRERLANTLQIQGMVWMDAKDYRAALVCFEEACVVDSLNASFHTNRAVACIKACLFFWKYADALKAMDSVMGCRGATVDDLVLRAKIRWAVGLVREMGNTDMLEAQGMQPKHPEVLMFMRRKLGETEELYAKAKAKAMNGDDRAAIKLLDMVAKAIPDDVKIPVIRATSRRRLGDYIGALKDLDLAGFQHFRGVYVGLRAVREAVAHMREFQPTPGTQSESSPTPGTHSESSPTPGTQSESRPYEQGQGLEVKVCSAIPSFHRFVLSAQAARTHNTKVDLSSEGRGKEGKGTDDLATAPTSLVTATPPPFTRELSTHPEPNPNPNPWQASRERKTMMLLQSQHRRAIPYAGQDPDYSFSLEDHLQPIGRRVLAPTLLIGPASPPAPQKMNPIPNPAEEAVREGKEAHAQVEGGEVGKKEGGGAQNVGYLEPIYITRQRELVLNDWALDMFQQGDFIKAVRAMNLVVASEQHLANTTGRALDSRFFINRGDCCRACGLAEEAVSDYHQALRVDPTNWDVKTRLSMAHYLQ